MKDLSNIQPQVIELMDKLLTKTKAIPHQAAGLGIAKDYNGENMSRKPFDLIIDHGWFHHRLQ